MNSLRVTRKTSRDLSDTFAAVSSSVFGDMKSDMADVFSPCAPSYLPEPLLITSLAATNRFVYSFCTLIAWRIAWPTAVIELRSPKVQVPFV